MITASLAEPAMLNAFTGNVMLPAVQIQTAMILIPELPTFVPILVLARQAVQALPAPLPVLPIPSAMTMMCLPQILVPMQVPASQFAGMSKVSSCFW